MITVYWNIKPQSGVSKENHQENASKWLHLKSVIFMQVHKIKEATVKL